MTVVGTQASETDSASLPLVITKMKTALALVMVCTGTLVFARPGLADQVTLTNGDRLTGRIVSSSARDIVIDTDLAGRIVLRRSAIKETTPAADGSVDAASTWSGTATVGLDLSRGNSDSRTITTIAKATRLTARDRLGLFGTSLFSGVGSGEAAVTTVRATRGGVRYDHDIHARLYGFGFADAENDPLKLLDMRVVAGGGAGAHVVRTANTQFNVFGGVSYARDAYTEVITIPQTPTTPAAGNSGGAPSNTPGNGGTPPGQGGTPPGQTKVQPTRTGTPPSVVRTSLSRRLGELIAGQDLTHQLSSTVGVSESLSFFPALSAFDDYRVSFDFTIWAQLNGWLQWNATVADRYLNIPPAGGAVQNDTFITTGMAIGFGRGDSGAYTGSDGRPPRR
jgi:hypothetical protein